MPARRAATNSSINRSYKNTGTSLDQRSTTTRTRRKLVGLSLLLCAAGVVATALPILGPGIAAAEVDIRVFRDPLKGGGDGPSMVVIPAGEFLMGSPKSEVGRKDNSEDPQHPVILPSFALGQTEVTVAEFGAFITATGYQTTAETQENCGRGRTWRNPGYQQTEAHPVVCIAFEDTQAYLAWLSEQTGRTYRMPSESEWEYAARAKTTTRYSFGNDRRGRELCKYANIYDRSRETLDGRKLAPPASCDDGFAVTTPVGSFKPNAFMLYDMHGNVWEWVQDCWNNRYDQTPGDGSPLRATLNGKCNGRVIRGGSFLSASHTVRSAYRGFTGVLLYSAVAERRGLNTDPVLNGMIDLGFRVVGTLDGPHPSTPPVNSR